MAMPTILRTPWAVAVAQGRGRTPRSGRFVADLVADWHRSGRLVALQAKWGLPPSDFLAAQQRALVADEDGLVCARGAAALSRRLPRRRGGASGGAAELARLGGAAAGASGLDRGAARSTASNRAGCCAASG